MSIDDKISQSLGLLPEVSQWMHNYNPLHFVHSLYISDEKVLPETFYEYLERLEDVGLPEEISQYHFERYVYWFVDFYEHYLEEKKTYYFFAHVMSKYQEMYDELTDDVKTYCNVGNKPETKVKSEEPFFVLGDCYGDLGMEDE